MAVQGSAPRVAAYAACTYLDNPRLTWCRSTQEDSWQRQKSCRGRGRNKSSIFIPTYDICLLTIRCGARPLKKETYVERRYMLALSPSRAIGPRIRPRPGGFDRSSLSPGRISFPFFPWHKARSSGGWLLWFSPSLVNFSAGLRATRGFSGGVGWM